MARNNDRDRGKRVTKDTRPSGKKKVCLFCSGHVDWVDYKDVNLLRRFMSDRARSGPAASPATACSTSALSPWRSRRHGRSACCHTPSAPSANGDRGVAEDAKVPARPRGVRNWC
jgi:ribosomal protein S18